MCLLVKMSVAIRCNCKEYYTLLITSQALSYTENNLSSLNEYRIICLDKEKTGRSGGIGLIIRVKCQNLWLVGWFEICFFNPNS